MLNSRLNVALDPRHERFKRQLLALHIEIIVCEKNIKLVLAQLEILLTLDNALKIIEYIFLSDFLQLFEAVFFRVFVNSQTVCVVQILEEVATRVLYHIVKLQHVCSAQTRAHIRVIKFNFTLKKLIALKKFSFVLFQKLLV